MTQLISTPTGYIQGVAFPIDITGYGRINTPDQWHKFVAHVEDMLIDDCNCVTPEQSCPACREAARETYGELPY